MAPADVDAYADPPAPPPPDARALAEISPPSIASEDTCVVLGAGIGGLSAAGLLLKRFRRVVVVEKDDLWARPAARARRGVPQQDHLHHLLPSGAEALEATFPGFFNRMQASGAAVGDPELRIRLYVGGEEVKKASSGSRTVFSRRPLIESVVRSLLVEQGGRRLEMVLGRAKSLLVDPRDRRVEGVFLEGPGGLREVRAALVVDCSGRNSLVGRWLERAGFSPPPAGVVDSMVQYCTRVFRPPFDWKQKHSGWNMIFARPLLPRETRIGALLALEDGRWGALMGGFDRDWAPRDVPGFLAFARTLNHPGPIRTVPPRPSRTIHELVSRGEAEGEASVFRSLGNRWLRWDLLPGSAVPAGVVQLGDSACTFNPFYAGGMTCAALQAGALDDLLASGADPRSAGFAPAYYGAARAVIGGFWDSAASTDRCFPNAVKEGPLSSGLEGRDRNLAAVEAYSFRARRRVLRASDY
eukprot:tig00000254_g22453.t1